MFWFYAVGITCFGLGFIFGAWLYGDTVPHEKLDPNDYDSLLRGN